MTKIALIDLETTGTDPAKHEIIEIACILIDAETLDVIKTLEIKVKPSHPETGDARAFEVNGYDAIDWQDAAPLKFAMAELAHLTVKATLMAYNVSFDYGFLKAAYDQTGVKDTMDYHRLDLMSMAWLTTQTHAWKMLHMPNIKLKTVAEYFGIEPEPAIHRAMNGAECAYKVFLELLRL